MTGKLQELLLRVDGLTLEKAVKVCRAYEQSNKQVKEFRDNSNTSNSSTKVNKVAQKPDPRVPRNKKPDNRHEKKVNEINCNFCVYQHEKSIEKCPAWGKTCDNCKGQNHFKSKCKKVHAVSMFQNGNEDFDDKWLMAVNYKEESINASLTINE